MINMVAEMYDPDAINEEVGTSTDKVETKKSDNSNYVIDLDDVDEDSFDGDFEPLPIGWYDAIIEKTEFYEKNNGNMIVKWQFSITTEGYENRKSFKHTVINHPIGQRIFKQIIMRAGIEITSQFNVKDFCEKGVAVNKPIRIYLKQDVYKDSKNLDDEGNPTIKETNVITKFQSPAVGDEYLSS